MIECNMILYKKYHMTPVLRNDGKENKIKQKYEYE